MIGQTKLQDTINRTIDRFPKFSIFVGPKGSGRKTLVKEVFKKLNVPIIEFGTSVDNVRDTIELAYEQTQPICYMCPEADGMSLSAKNGLLKVTEEPPQNAYFVIILEDLCNTLETIQSRGTPFILDPYSKEELISYRKYRQYKPDYDKIIEDVCDNTGEVDELFSCDILKFYRFAETIVNSIHIPTSGNIFKISKQVKTKDNADGYDGLLLFKAVRNLFLKKGIETKEKKYLAASMVTSECLRDLRLTTVNKVGTVDMWIMNVRGVLR